VGDAELHIFLFRYEILDAKRPESIQKERQRLLPVPDPPAVLTQRYQENRESKASKTGIGER
jgi:hypothetical protein